MSFVFRYLRDHLHLLMAGTAFICFFAISFALYHLPLAAVAYPTGLCLLLGCLLAVSPVRKAYQKHEALTKICLHRWNTVNNELLLYLGRENLLVVAASGRQYITYLLH